MKNVFVSHVHQTEQNRSPQLHVQIQTVIQSNLNQLNQLKISTLKGYRGQWYTVSALPYPAVEVASQFQRKAFFCSLTLQVALAASLHLSPTLLFASVFKLSLQYYVIYFWSYTCAREFALTRHIFKTTTFIFSQCPTDYRFFCLPNPCSIVQARSYYMW